MTACFVASDYSVAQQGLRYNLDTNRIVKKQLPFQQRKKKTTGET
jgi:hypothetical protein